MSKNIVEKILAEHLVEGKLEKGEEISIKIDQTLTQDATGTMAYLAFEALDIPKVKTELSVSYIDHNTLQTGFENADDHLFLQTVAEKYGIYCSKPGNGICHKLHVERFAIPGKTLLGADSHTPTTGALGSIAIGAGGLDVALAMAGESFSLTVPEVIKVQLEGTLNPGVSAKDVSLYLLSQVGVKGGVNKIMEYSGEGIKNFSIPERGTMTNMGAEMGLTTSIFPSDEVTKDYMKSQGREEDWVELKADQDAQYDQIIKINLDQLQPLLAKPHMPDLVDKVENFKDKKIDQVFIGSCTNASYVDIARAAKILKGKKVHKEVSLCVAPGSKQVFEMIIRDGILNDLVSAGARILESACGPCVGIGQSPKSGAVSLRTSNRNFLGRSGTKDAGIYLVSPETAAASAVKGYFDTAEGLDILNGVIETEDYILDDSLIIKPSDEEVEVVKGPNIGDMPIKEELKDKLECEIVMKTEDNITTDDIMPAGAKILPLRSNIPKISEYVYSVIDEDFVNRAKKAEKSVIVGGENYGQGSSREHAAIAPMYLGIQAVVAKSFARIHKKNLINFGIIPLVFENKEDYDTINRGDTIKINNLIKQIMNETVEAETQAKKINLKLEVSEIDRKVLKAGGKLNYIKNKNQ